MSVNIVDAACELAAENALPIVLIFSRRQVEAAALGGGYVNHWTTEDFVHEIRKKKNPYVFLARDHGGPMQGSYEAGRNPSVDEAMDIARKSFEVDVEQGVQFIHIDPSVPIGKEKLGCATVLSRLIELYGHVCELAKRRNKEIAIEVGTEEQNGAIQDPEVLQELLEQTASFARQNGFPAPLFVVCQTGTKTMETRNIGVFESPLISARCRMIRRIQGMAELAGRYNCYIKEHNADYLSSDNLALRPYIGIKATNVAPEFGVVETRSLIHLMRTYGAERDYNEFVQLSSGTGKWKKWMLPDSPATPVEKAIIGGHYCFSDPRVVEIKARLRTRLLREGIDLDSHLKRRVKSAISRYAQAFGLL
jgi:hypothetical protein